MYYSLYSCRLDFTLFTLIYQDFSTVFLNTFYLFTRLCERIQPVTSAI